MRFLGRLQLPAWAGGPSAPQDGEVWYDSTATKLRGREAGATVDLFSPAGSVSASTVEVNLGNSPINSGSFVITTTGLSTGRPVLVTQAVGPYTGKGAGADEAEMDDVSVSASATSATQVTCYWRSSGPVMGNFKFDYVPL